MRSDTERWCQQCDTSVESRGSGAWFTGTNLGLSLTGLAATSHNPSQRAIVGLVPPERHGLLYQVAGGTRHPYPRGTEGGATFRWPTSSAALWA
jgi:hypothetical protein